MAPAEEILIQEPQSRLMDLRKGVENQKKRSEGGYEEQSIKVTLAHAVA